MPDFTFWVTIVTIVVVMGVMLATCAYLIYVERKIAAWVQDRIGPNRVGPFGLLQPIADGLKFLLKEDIIPDARRQAVYLLLAPAIAVSTALARLRRRAVRADDAATSPPERAQRGDSTIMSTTYQFVIAPDVDIGIVFVFAVTSLTVYAIILGGWSSNNKYSFLGGLRSSAQLDQLRDPDGHVDPRRRPADRLAQPGTDHRPPGRRRHLGWNIWYQPLAFLLFLDQRLRRVQPAAVRSAGGGAGAGRAATTPSTAP